MSIVACKVHNDKIVFGSDSIVVRGWGGTQEKGKDNFTKLVQLNEVILGGVGTAQELSLFISYISTRKPKDNTEDSILDFTCDFVEWKKSKINISDIENYYLLGFRGKVFSIQRFFVKEVVNYEAIGAGMDYALSVLYLGLPVQKAIEVACELSIYCEKPMKILEMNR